MYFDIDSEWTRKPCLFVALPQWIAYLTVKTGLIREESRFSWSNTALVFNLNACVYSVSLVLSFAKLFVRLFLPVCGP